MINRYQYDLYVQGVYKETLEILPKGWDDKGLTFQVNENYNAVLSIFTIGKLGFHRDQGSRKGGLNSIMEAYETYGYGVDLALQIKYRDPKTNQFVNWPYTCKLSWANDVEQNYDELEDIVYMQLTDNSYNEKLRENDEVEVDALRTTDLENNDLTDIKSTETVTVLKQNLFKHVDARYGRFLEEHLHVSGDTGWGNWAEVPPAVPVAEIYEDTLTDGDWSILNWEAQILFENPIEDDEEKIVNISIPESTESNEGHPQPYPTGLHITHGFTKTSDSNSASLSTRHRIKLVLEDDEGTVLNELFIFNKDYADVSFVYEPAGPYLFEYDENFDETEFTITVPAGGLIRFISTVEYIFTDWVDRTIGVSLGYFMAFDFLMTTDSIVPESTNVEMILPHEAMENMLKIVTGLDVELQSTVLGRTDLSYDEDGELSLLGITMGWQLRKTPLQQKTITLELLKLFTTLDAILPIYLMYDYSINKYVIESRDDWFTQIDMDNLIKAPDNFSRIIPKDGYFNKIECGQDNTVEYETYTGTEESNIPVVFSTEFAVKKTHQARASYNLDPTGIEVQRRLSWGENAFIDSKNDSNVYLVVLERKVGDPDALFVTKRMDAPGQIVNVLNGANRLNFEITPRRNLLRRIGLISAIYFKHPTSVFSFSSSQMDSNMGVQLPEEAEISYEKDPISAVTLPNGYPIPEKIKFDWPVTDELIADIIAKPWQVFLVYNDLGTFYGRIGLDGIRTNSYDRIGNFVLDVCFFDIP